jgi:hypothetical protein
MSEKTHSSGWVWISTEDSIQRGQISRLALLEIPLAMAFFWWLSSLSPWPWLTLIGLMAAPVLLLRSPESVAAGKEMLAGYMENKEVSTGQDWLTGLVAVGLAAGLSYWGAQHFLFGQTGWAAFWRGAMLGGLEITLVIIFTSAIVTTRALTVALIFALTLALAVASSIAGAMAGASVGAGMGMLVLINTITRKYFFIPILPLAISLGSFVRAVFIRLWATLQYWSLGLAAFPRNWRETVCVIDARHLPELLPGAGEVSDAFSFRGLLKYKIRSKFNEKIFDLLLLTILAPLIYLSALLYRWNLKASAWLWGPVALLLSPVLWANDEEMRHKTAYWTTSVLQPILRRMWVGFVCWLLSPCLYLSDYVRALFPQTAVVFYKHMLLPALGLRYGLLCLLALSLFRLYAAAYRVQTTHKKALEGAGDFEKGYSEKLKTEFRRLAIPVSRWLRVNLVLMTFNIWAFAWQWAVQRWPDQLQHITWPWLRPWL